jgi:hypothetical protein
MTTLTTATEIAQGMLEKGELANAADANVHIVRLMGVRIIRTSLPKDVRAALNVAVKEGKLGRLPKKGLEPEAYFHPNSKWAAMEQRSRIALEKVGALQKVLGRDIAELGAV